MKFTKTEQKKDPDSAKNIAEKSSIKKKKKHTWKTSLVLLLLGIPLYFYFSFALFHIDQFETADEYRWIYNTESRVPQYWQAMMSKDWKRTYINDKPGVSTAVVSGLGLWYLGEDSLKERIPVQNDYSFIFNPAASKNIDFAFRLPLVIFNGLLSLRWYFILRRILDSNWAALVACSLILFSPILIGITQIVNPDALLWSTSFTAILSFIAFLKDRKIYDGLFFGFFLGLALLSKYTAVIIVPWAFFMALGYLIYKYDEFKNNEELFQKRTLQYFCGLLFFTALGALVYALLMPAVFLNPKIITKGNDAFREIAPYIKLIWQIVILVLIDAVAFKSWTLRHLLFPLKYLWNVGTRVFFAISAFILALVVSNWAGGNTWEIPGLPYDAGKGFGFADLPLIQKIFLEIRPLAFSIIIIAVVFMAIAWAIYAFKKNTTHAFTLFALSAFLVFFYVAVITEGYLVQIRYSIMLFAPVAVIAAIGISAALPKIRYHEILYGLAFCIVIFFSLNELKNISPFYFNYTNDLLSKDQIITSAWGYGGYEVAQFINSQTENPENLIIWTDYGGVCAFFPGTCIMDSDIKWVGYQTVNKIAYYVVTPRGSDQFKDTWAKMRPNAAEQPDWKLEIGDRPGNYVAVFKVLKSDFKNNNWWKNK